VHGVLLPADQMPPASSPRRSTWLALAALTLMPVLGVLIEGTVQTLVEHIPKERQSKIAAALRQLLDERMRASGVPDGEG